MQFYQYLLSFLPKKKVESPESATILPTPAQTRVSWKNTNSTDSDSTSLHKTFPHTLLLLGNKLWFNNFWEPYVLTFSLPLPFSPFSPWQCPNFSNQTSLYIWRGENVHPIHQRIEVTAMPWIVSDAGAAHFNTHYHHFIWGLSCIVWWRYEYDFLTFRVNLRQNQKKSQIFF